MAKYSVCDLAYNDEPHMRACLESVADWGVELVVVDFHGTDRLGRHILPRRRSLDGYGIRSALQSATSKVEAVRRWSDLHA
jgi:glycosyltransferase involved in cell wall biosynthesis